MPAGRIPSRPIGAVILKLSAGAELPTGDGPWELSKVLPDAELSKGLGTLKVRPAYKERGQLDELVGRAKKFDRKYVAPDWDRFVEVQLRDSDIATLTKDVSRDKTVLFIQPAPHPAPPPVSIPVPADEPTANFAWLRQAPEGVGAQPLWASSTGSSFAGAGARILLVEPGCAVGLHQDIDWTKVHLDSGSVARNTSSGANDKSHGLKTLGVLCAKVDPVPPPSKADLPLGLANGVDEVLVFAAGNPPSDPDASKATDLLTALTEAISACKPRDILLLELQTVFSGTTSTGTVLPGSLAALEVWEIFFNLIRLATALQVVVIEPAGNGFYNWDSVPDVPGSIDFNAHDSGAIMVASAAFDGTSQWTAHYTSNKGQRIDCFAQGDQVLTTGDTSTGYIHYSGTSAASAIVAAAAAVVQGVKHATTGKIGPTEMRTLLHDTGTTPAVGEAIGTMPNLQAIFGSTPVTAADLVIRDSAADDGSPQSGTLWRSPDIVVQQASLPEPGGPVDGPSPVIDATEDHTIWCFAHNRGGATAKGVKATVWYAPPTLLMTPSAWTELGQVSFGDIPATTTPVRSSPLTWPKDKIPGAGHYCFVAQVHSPDDPASGISKLAQISIGSWADYVGADNNLAWRNFNVADIAPDTPTHLPFFARGAEDRGHRFSVEIITTLPPGSCVELVHRGRMICRRDFGKRTRLIRRQGCHILPLRGGRIGPAVLRPKTSIPMAVCLTVPALRHPGSYVVVARQLHRDREVGRVTWVVRVPAACP